LSAKNISGEALSMEASREFSRTPPRLPPCSDVSVLQKTRMSHFWDTHHSTDHVNLLISTFPGSFIGPGNSYPCSRSETIDSLREILGLLWIFCCAERAIPACEGTHSVKIWPDLQFSRYPRKSQTSGPNATFLAQARTADRINLGKPCWPITCPCLTLASDRAQARSKCAQRHFASSVG